MNNKEGIWIEYDEHPLLRGRCSLCGWEAHLYEDDVLGMPYCPNCGHKMRGIIDEKDYKGQKILVVYK